MSERAKPGQTGGEGVHARSRSEGVGASSCRGAAGHAYFRASGVTVTVTRSPLRSTATVTGWPIFTASIA